MEIGMWIDRSIRGLLVPPVHHPFWRMRQSRYSLRIGICHGGERRAAWGRRGDAAMWNRGWCIQSVFFVGAVVDPVCLLSPPFTGVLCLVLMMIFPLPLHPLILVHEMHNCVQYRIPAPVIYTEISRRRMDATYEPLLLKSLVIHGEVMIGAIDPHLQSMCSIDNTRHLFDRANSELDQFMVASDWIGWKRNLHGVHPL